jgi:hypothetical protein
MNDPVSTLQEDKANNVLLYSCRNCRYEEETSNPCVFRHDLLVVTRCADFNSDLLELLLILYLIEY